MGGGESGAFQRKKPQLLASRWVFRLHWCTRSSSTATGCNFISSTWPSGLPP